MEVTEHTSAGSFDGYLLTLDAARDFQWIRQFGGSGPDRANSLVPEKSRHLYVTGSFNGTVDLDRGPGSNLRIAQGAKPYSKRRTLPSFCGILKQQG